MLLLRTAAALAALVALTAATPMQRQPTPAALQGGPSTEQASADQQMNASALGEARRKADAQMSVWEAKVKRSLNGICRGC
ncbi:hypothetical protein [Methylobacterium sp. A54F]